MVTEHQISGEMRIKETKTRIIEKPASKENVTTMGKRDTGRFIVGSRRKRNKMTLETSLLGPNYVDKYHKLTRNKNSKNGWEKAVRHHISHARRKT